MRSTLPWKWLPCPASSYAASCVSRAPTEDPDEQTAAFARMRELLETANDRGLSLDTLSMGMSGDYRAAVAEGATLVRIGTAVFGPRPVDEAAQAEQ
jgi:uncharacterized pyridoxal phosphate-containing UPF0001 family protein